MLDIINNLSVFFEDAYRELGVREYSRLKKISPPTASKLLKDYWKEGLLKKREERGYLLFRANRESYILKTLSKIYWKEKLFPLIEYLNTELNYPSIVLFGSLNKLEVKEESDIDLAIFTKHNKKIDTNHIEKNLKRKIQIFIFPSLASINSKELKTNILNGCVMQGELS